MANARGIFGEEDFRLDEAIDAERYNRESPYNHFGYQPVRKEHRHSPARVSGALPPDLEGAYLRNGTNVQFDKVTVRAHAFNGAGMLHQVQIRDGRATYSNTYVRTPRYEFESEAGREVYPSYGDMACSGMPGLERIRLSDRKRASGLIPDWSALEANPASTSIQYHDGRLYCLQGSGLPFVLDAEVTDGLLTLDGRGHLESWEGRLPVPFSAHPRIDPDNGDFHGVSLDSSGRALWQMQVSGGELVHCTRVHQFAPDTPITGTIHDYFLTANHVVIADVSLRLSPRYISGPGGSFWQFEPSHRLRWGVMPRDPARGGGVQWFETANPGMIWHVVNAWEETAGGDRIVLYAPVFSEYPPDVPIHTPKEPPARLTRWVLDLRSGKVEEERRLLQHGYERPSLNLSRVGKQSRYAYLIDEESVGYMGKGVLKYDLIDEREVAFFDYGAKFGGEALFVPRAGSVAEDDGYLLDLLMSEGEGELLVLDAATMKELARVHLPARVPFGVHACWLDNAKLAAISSRANGNRTPRSR